MTARIVGQGLGSLIPKRQSINGNQRPIPNNPRLDVNAQALSATPRVPASAEPKASPASATLVGETIKLIPINQIDANPFQPRQSIDHVSLDDLIRSIREHGILQPLIMTEQRGRYQLVAGERRFQSARILGLKTVPAIIRNPSDQQKLELALVENIQRKDLDPIEKAKGYQRLMDDFSLTQDEVAHRVGKGRVSVAQSLRLLALPIEIQQSLAAGEISEGHGKVLLALGDRRSQLKAWQQIRSQGLSVRASEGVNRALGVPSKRRATNDPVTIEAEDELQQYLGTRVRVKQHGRKGSIVIEFFSPEERYAIIKKIIKK